jgi:hypothetical protein
LVRKRFTGSIPVVGSIRISDLIIININNML